MARLYFLSNLTSDLTGGADFNMDLVSSPIDEVGTVQCSHTSQQTKLSYAFTPPLHPGTSGSIVGNYTVNFSIASGSTSLTLTMTLRRVNSAGTVQTSSTTSAGQTLGTGVKTFTFTNLNLGTFLATDRLRIDFNIVNGAMNTQNATIVVNSSDSYVLAPWTVRRLNFS
jgi:tetrahydromethanopterin S-methyltransferase subunit C